MSDYKYTKLLTLGAAFLVSACCSTPPMPSTVLRDPNPQQYVFQTPESAVESLVGATRQDQTEEMVKILGPQSKRLVYSGDKIADNNSRDMFVAAYDQEHELVRQNDDRDVLEVGEQEWPLPIPLDMVQGGWQWNTEAGAAEIINRRIGRNELNVIEVARAYVEAQREYAALHPLGVGKHEYAQHFLSRDGKRNGLYWPVKVGEPESPLGPLIAQARAEGYLDKDGHHKKHTPYHGYFFKILKSQGVHAPEGAQNYIDKQGRMTRGFGMIAYPARYGDSGIMTFIIDDDGIAHQKNLGPATAKLAREIKSYDPDPSWNAVE